MSVPPEPCRTCDGLGFVETAAQDSRVIHQEPCPDCAGARPVAGTREERDALIAALAQEYADVLARRGLWRLMAGQEAQVNRILEDGARSALLHVAERLGVTNLHERAAAVLARGESS